MQVSIEKCFNTVLLKHFKERAFVFKRGVVYIKNQTFVRQKGHICSIHVSFIDFRVPNTSIATSVKPLFFKHFTTFHTTKNNLNSHPNHLQTLINQALSRIHSKINFLTEINYHIYTNVTVSKITQNLSKS